MRLRATRKAQRGELPPLLEGGDVADRPTSRGRSAPDGHRGPASRDDSDDFVHSAILKARGTKGKNKKASESEKRLFGRFVDKC